MIEYEDRMARLRLRFAERLKAEKLLLEQALESGDRGEIRRLAHGLSGSGAIFGYPDVSVAGQRLEAAVDEGEALQLPAEALLKIMAAAVSVAKSGS
jgi:HPt (histidine-containing phosphotransfer) domain-containing protein